MYSLLDLFCGAGGAAMGYHRAGFEVVGVDIAPQKHYPFEFHQADALEYCAEHGKEFDAIHASPPCQRYSATKSLTRRIYQKLIEPTRRVLIESCKPYIIENVVGAPLLNPTLLCGTMFGLQTYRHRLFETSFEIPFFLHMTHGATKDDMKWPSKQLMGYMVQVVGHPRYKGAAKRYREAMQIDWMSSDEITEAIPPAYTEFIGKHLIRYLQYNAQECYSDDRKS